MGRATRWLKSLLGLKREKPSDDRRERKRWSFAKSSKEHDPSSLRSNSSSAWLRSSYMAEPDKDQSNHAIALAAATSAAAHAAVAAAHAAVVVASLASRTTVAEAWAAVKIQSLFRGFLARKARRALRGLVKLQALVRGFLIRKRASAMLHSMRAMMRAQTAARLRRSSRLLPRNSLDRSKDIRSEIHSKRLSTPFEDLDDSPRTVQIEAYKPKTRSRKIDESQTVNDLECSSTGDDYWSSTAQNTPRFAGLFLGRRGIPAKKFFRRDADFPNYMTNTQSFRAKLRSQSVPKQRIERHSLGEVMASRNSVSSSRIHRSNPRVEEERRR